MWSKYPPILKNTIDFIATYSEPWRSFRGFLELKHLRQLYPKSRSSFQNLPRLTLGLEHPNMRAYNVHFTCDTGCNIKKSHSGDRLHALFRCTCVRCTFSFLFNFTLQKLASFGVLYLYGKEDLFKLRNSGIPGFGWQLFTFMQSFKLCPTLRASWKGWINRSTS